MSNGAGGRWAGSWEIRDAVPRPPVFFAAEFSAPTGEGGAFTGRVSGPTLGGGDALPVERAACANGRVRFRVTLPAAPGRLPVCLWFVGELSPDGETLSGTVRVVRRRGAEERTSVGRWEARRA